MAIDDELDWDQRPDADGAPTNSSFNDIYNEATVKALGAVIEAIDRGTSTSDVRALCERGIEALGRKQ